MIFYFVLTNAVLGVVLSVTFQLAHCVDDVEFPSQPEAGAMPYGWAEHQVRTTADFARGNRLVTWYVGGLNYQIEHHLFPSMPRPHLRLAQPLVRAHCRELGIPYAETGLVDSYRQALCHLHAVGEPLRAE